LGCADHDRRRRGHGGAADEEEDDGKEEQRAHTHHFPPTRLLKSIPIPVETPYRPKYIVLGRELG
jgi:hypothetical protein